MAVTFFRLCVGLLFLVVINGCATHSHFRSPLATWAASPNFNTRQPVLIVIHATEQHSVEQSLKTLSTANSGGKVSAHYLIGRDGHIYQLVADDQRAWHAGSGRWGAITDVNAASIGIELDNDGSADYPESQIAALLSLLDDLCTRLAIPRTQIIAHADLAPTRKRDPGAQFPWRFLAQNGFGIWPADNAPPAPEQFDIWLGLTALGYPSDTPEASLRAFQRRFRGIASTYDDMPQPDAEDARLLHALLSGNTLSTK